MIDSVAIAMLLLLIFGFCLSFSVTACIVWYWRMGKDDSQRAGLSPGGDPGYDRLKLKSLWRALP